MNLEKEAMKWESNVLNRYSFTVHICRTHYHGSLQLELDGGDYINTEIDSVGDLTKLKDPYLKSGLEILSDLIVFKMG